MLYILGMVLLLAGGALYIGGYVWFVVEGFRTSIVWGIGNLIVPFMPLVWLILYWEQGKRPFLATIAGAFVLSLGLVMTVMGGVTSSGQSSNTLIASRNAALSNPSGELSSDSEADDEGDTADGDVLDTAQRNADAANAAGSESPVASSGSVPATPGPALPPAVAPQPPPVNSSAELDKLEAMMAGGGTATAMNQPPRSFPQAVAPAPAAPAPPLNPGVGASVAAPPSIPSAVVEGVPVETLWPPYFAAVRKLRAGDVSGVREIEKVLSRDDIQWLNQNAGHIVELVTPGSGYSGEQAKLIALNAMLRNMPQSSQSPVSAKSRHGVAVAELTDSSSGKPQRYSSVLVQENGRWVLAHMFYTRDFVWVPQLAYYKQARGLPMTNEEKVFLTQGFQPFQQQVQTVYKSVGYGG